MNRKNRQKIVFIIHTSNVSVNDSNNLFNELAPDVIVRNIIDDSLLPEVLANGKVTKNVLLKGYIHMLFKQKQQELI